MCEVALIGRPNAGKTTIFNGLTGLNARTGNWHGVTVDEKKGKIKNSKITICDLPGIYSLNAFSPEEKVSEKYISENPNTLFLSVVPATDFLQGIKTTLALLNKGVKTALVLTFYDEFIKSGGKLNINKLAAMLAIPVIAVNGNDTFDVKRLKKFALNAINNTYAHTFSVKNTAYDFTSVFSPSLLKGNFLDKILLNKYLCPFCFLIIISVTFYVAFGEYSLGVLLQNAAAAAMNFLTLSIENFLYSTGVTKPVIKFVSEGLIGGAFSVISFIPQLAVLYLFLTLFEESGIMARIAFMFDDVFEKIGLNGRAVFSMFIGFGCTAIAELSTKALDNKSLQKKTALALPFVSCSAKLPVYLVLVNTFFAKGKVVLLLFVYLSGVLLAALTAWILNKFAFKSPQTFIMELPPLRLVGIKKLSKTLLYYLKQFIIKVGSVIAAVVIALWFLKSFSPSLNYVGENISASILCEIGKLLKYLFYPMGVTDWRISVSAISGIFAKEAIVGTLELLCPEGIRSLLTPAQALAFLCFCATYTPCLSALATIKKLIGGKYAFLCGVGTFIFALFFGYVTYFFALSVQIANINPALVIFVIVAIVFITAVKLSVKNKCRNCHNCTDGKYEGNCKYEKRKIS